MLTNSFKTYLNKFDKLTSNNGTDSVLCFIWLVFFQFLSTILEYEYIDISHNYVYFIQDGIYKELLISFIFVLFIWYCVYSIIFMYRKQFITLALYTSVCLYLLITHDISFNLLIHNLNPYELIIDGFGFYLFFQLFLKLIITYLLIKMLIVIRNKN